MSQSFSFQSFAQNMSMKIEAPVRTHLAKVYSCLAATTAVAAVGAFVHLREIWQAGIMSALVSLGLVLALHFVPYNGKNLQMRLAMLMGFGFFTGNSMGPLLDHVILLNPQIIVTALVGTCVVFVSFTLAALLAHRGQYLFLGGILISILSYMGLFSLLNLFMRSPLVYQGQLYIGLGVMSAFILYDTQAIMEKCRMGSKDIVGHSLDLFFDLVSIFRRLLVILSQKEQRDQQNRRKRN
ncbi:bax inhibitor 1 [Lutzomyia longipalpis]|uniref:Bax-mediated apoptosis inhibitor tegt/bi-1 n=2 Tax=Lutzomyia longipalpis TaxID=7200 RepID=A0A1B0CQL2_LUTLO|nr:bax inhibitor 1 [Lutzomyia longipalpis]